MGRPPKVFQPSGRAETKPDSPAGIWEHPLGGTAPAAAAARGPRGLTKGSVGRGHVTGPSAASRAGREEGPPARVPSGFLTEKELLVSVWLRRQRSAGRRSTCLAPRWRSRTSHLSDSYLKSTWKKLCVRGGPRGGPGPGCKAEGGRLVGGWEEVEETAPF